VTHKPFQDEAQTASFKDPVLTEAVRLVNLVLKGERRKGGEGGGGGGG